MKQLSMPDGWSFSQPEPGGSPLLTDPTGDGFYLDLYSKGFFHRFAAAMFAGTDHLRSTDPTEPVPLDSLETAEAEARPISTLKVVTLRETNARDIVATLRRIADELEAGDYGPTKAGALVLDTSALDIFFFGDGEAGPEAHLLFSAAAAKMLKKVLDNKEGN